MANGIDNNRKHAIRFFCELLTYCIERSWYTSTVPAVAYTSRIAFVSSYLVGVALLPRLFALFRSWPFSLDPLLINIPLLLFLNVFFCCFLALYFSFGTLVRTAFLLPSSFLFSLLIHSDAAWRPCTNFLNPLRPKSDKHQFSPKNINAQSKEKVVRINEIITHKRK